MSTESWHMAALALQLLAVDPAGLGGAVIRMRAGPDRESVLARLPTTTPLRKMPPSISDEQLFGGIDLSATLATSRVVHGKGFFETSCIAVIPMALIAEKASLFCNFNLLQPSSTHFQNNSPSCSAQPGLVLK